MTSVTSHRGNFHGFLADPGSSVIGFWFGRAHVANFFARFETIPLDRFRLGSVELDRGTALAVVPVLPVLFDLEVERFALRLNFVARFRVADPGWMERIQFVVQMIELLH
jgi:hypothetical protein